MNELLANVMDTEVLMPDSEFGMGYVLRQVVNSVQSIDNKLEGLVSKDEYRRDVRDLKAALAEKAEKSELEKLAQDVKAGPLPTWLWTAASAVAAVIAVMASLHLF